MKIVWEQSVYVGNAPVFCAICGHRAYPTRGSRNQLLLAVIYDYQGVACGEACRGCVASGASGIRQKLQDQIQSFQKKIAELEHLGVGEVQPPSLEEEFQLHRQDVS
ncbi:MAG: hypothetical protein KME11_17180 [Timaviella obliquedivisa GSE-PSE-MK23-08B]|nr:hypothetical protein [Timaviella obliquedivisa GSE-PSE-MK23-08B]